MERHAQCVQTRSRMNDYPEIFIWRNGRQEGPISARALEGAIRLGSIPPETPAWTRSQPEWKTAIKILNDTPSKEQEPRPAPVCKPIHKALQKVKPTKTIETWLLSGIGLAVICGLLLYLASSRTSVKQTSADRPIPDNPEFQPQEIETNSHLPSGPVGSGRNASSLEESEQCVLMARSTQNRGSAFIAMENGKAYVYTNVHVASARNLEFADFRGTPVRVSHAGEVVGLSRTGAEEDGIDIVRFPLIDPPRVSLNFANRAIIENKPEVWTLGDSGGESILKTLKGRIKGVGPAKIEVDCEFIQGNSGGPIVTADGHVVGIASYMTTNQSIWAKGTEQEIRRIAWIPGKSFPWVPTTANQLAEEQSILEECVMTSDLMIVISYLQTENDGFEPPDDFPDVARQVIAEAANHPLKEGVNEANRAILALSKKSGSAQMESHREYLRFFKSCVDYQKSQLEKAEREIKSSFWRHQLDLRIQNHRGNLENFKSQLIRFQESGGAGKSLLNS